MNIFTQPCSRYIVKIGFGPMSVIYCAVELRRKPAYYVMHLILPVVTMSIVSMFVFALPVESGEKISLGISVLISYSVLTLLVANHMPTNADAIPVLCRYPVCVILSFIFLRQRCRTELKPRSSLVAPQAISPLPQLPFDVQTLQIE